VKDNCGVLVAVAGGGVAVGSAVGEGVGVASARKLQASVEAARNRMKTSPFFSM
jgi:hypothetical protein